VVAHPRRTPADEFTGLINDAFNGLGVLILGAVAAGTVVWGWRVDTPATVVLLGAVGALLAIAGGEVAAGRVVGVRPAARLALLALGIAAVVAGWLSYLIVVG
jgi:hypothetical protein